MDQRIFAGGQILRSDRQPLGTGQHAVLRHILRLQCQHRIAHQRARVDKLPAGGDVRFSLRASTAALGKIVSIDGQVATAQQRTGVAERRAAYAQGGALNGTAVIQRAGIQLSAVTRQQLALYRQGVAAYRQVLPGYHLPLRFQRIAGFSLDMAGGVNLTGGILANIFRGKRRIASGSQLFISV